jgi:hypothetical protein
MSFSFSKFIAKGLERWKGNKKAFSQFDLLFLRDQFKLVGQSRDDKKKTFLSSFSKFKLSL